MGEVIKLNTEQYGEKLFKKWAKSISKNCGGIQIFTHLSYSGHPLIDHPLIVDCVPVWSKGKLNGHEFAMICRTYATDDAIDNPPEGLKTWRLPKEVLGTSPGTAIAVMIDDNTPESNQLLQSYLGLPTRYLPQALSIKMLDNGYYIRVSAEKYTQYSTKLQIMRRKI